MGKLCFRYGAMSSGKSTSLMQLAHNYEKIGKKVLVVKSVVDTKGDNQLVSRIGLTRTVDVLIQPRESFSNYKDQLLSSDVVFIDEAQFLSREQVNELWSFAHIFDIPVYAYGLSTTFQSTFFPGSCRLFEVADEKEELKTICPYCGKVACFSARMVNGKFTKSGEQTIIDGSDETVLYVPLDADCYLREVLNVTKDNIWE